MVNADNMLTLNMDNADDLVKMLRSYFEDNKELLKAVERLGEELKQAKEKIDEQAKKLAQHESLGVQKEYKDRVFKFLFGSPERKDWTLSLYNAIRGTHYTDPDMITFNTIGDVIYMGMKNDVSFLISSEMQMWEHQSTYNPNMPLRFLFYGAALYEKYAKEKDLRMNSSRRQSIPCPVCICFYNGTDRKLEKAVLRLSDAYKGEGDFEVKVTMLNVNQGMNTDVVDACEPLREYAWLVEEIRRRQSEGAALLAAVDESIDAMPDDFVVKELLLANRVEVKKMILTEYNEQKERDDLVKDTREEERRETALKMLKRKKPLSEIIEFSELGAEEIRELAFLNDLEVHDEDATLQARNEEIALELLKRKKPLSEIVEFSKLGEEEIRELAARNGIEVCEEDPALQAMVEEIALELLKIGRSLPEVVKVSKLGEEKVRYLASKHGIPLAE